MVEGLKLAAQTFNKDEAAFQLAGEDKEAMSAYIGIAIRPITLGERTYRARLPARLVTAGLHHGRLRRSTMRPCNGCVSCARPSIWYRCSARLYVRSSSGRRTSRSAFAVPVGRARRAALAHLDAQATGLRAADGRTRRHCRERLKLPPETRQPVSGYLWGALVVLDLPSPSPILAAVRDDRRCPWRKIGCCASSR